MGIDCLYFGNSKQTHVAAGKDIMVGGEFRDRGIGPYRLRKEIWMMPSILGEAMRTFEQWSDTI